MPPGTMLAAGACTLPAGDECPAAASCATCDHYRRAAPAALEGAAHERARIFDTIDGAGRAGLTVEQVARRVGLREPAVRCRLDELLREGAIVRRRGKRRTSAGGWAAVFVLPWGRS